MNKLEQLVDEANNLDIDTLTADLPANISGIYYCNGVDKPLIALNKTLPTLSEQMCVLAEEIGHFYTSYGNLLTDPKTDNIVIEKQETKSRRWAVKKLVPFEKIIAAFEHGCRNFYEYAEYIGTTENFLREAFNNYRAMYGRYNVYGNYIIFFDPPGVYKNMI